MEKLEARWLLAAPHPLDVSQLIANSGLRIPGLDTGDLLAVSVSVAGDVNGDGLNDLVIGAKGASPPGRAFAGQAFVVFGRADRSFATFDLAQLNGGNGFRLDGLAANDGLGHTVNGAGDFNGDSLADLLISADAAAPGGRASAGETYIIFGRTTGFPPVLDLASLNGSNGFRIPGISAGDNSGIATAAAGDVNGDGFDDIIIGANNATVAGAGSAGQSYVVFGASGGFPASLTLSALNGSNGFRIEGAGQAAQLGRSVSSAGDVNGDGLADVIVGAPLAENVRGAAYVVFGKAGGFPAAVDVATLDGGNGFRFAGGEAGSNTGIAVSTAGDVNGDGFDDLLIGADLAPDNGAAYVVFGHSGAFPAAIDPSMLNGALGFRILSGTDDFLFGNDVARAGDVNGDGFDDMLISSLHGDDSNGANYLLFGSSGPFAATFDIATVNGDNGFRIDLGGVGNLFADTMSGGDVDGDGFDDMLVGSPFVNDFAGEAALVFGANFRNLSHLQTGGSAADMLTGSAAVDLLIGGQGADLLLGNGGADVLRGGAGHDTLAISDLTFRRIDGGLGHDVLRLDGANLMLDLTTLADNRLVGIEEIDLRGSGPNSLRLSAREVLNLSGHSNTLLIRRRIGVDTVDLGTGWTTGSPEVIGSVPFQVFSQGAAIVKVQSAASAVQIQLDQTTVKENIAGAAIGQLSLVPPPAEPVTLTVDDARFTILQGQLRLVAGQYLVRNQAAMVEITITATSPTDPEFIVQRTLSLEVLPNPFPAHNSALPEDVNGDGRVQALDALLLINYLNSTATRDMSLVFAQPGQPLFFYDVVPNLLASAQDVLAIINHINARPSGAVGEGEADVATSSRSLGENAVNNFLRPTDSLPRNHKFLNTNKFRGQRRHDERWLAITAETEAWDDALLSVLDAAD